MAVHTAKIVSWLFKKKKKVEHKEIMQISVGNHWTRENWLSKKKIERRNWPTIYNLFEEDSIKKYSIVVKYMQIKS